MANVIQSLATSVLSALIRPFSRLTQAKSPVAQYETLELDPATLLLTEDKPNSRQILSVVGGTVSSVVGTSPMILVSTSVGVATVSCNGAQAATGLTLCQRVSDGSICASYFTTALSAVASDGILRLPVGDGNIISIKGASHTSVPLLATANGGSTIALGDGIEIQGVNFQSALLSQIGPVSFGVGVIPAFSQPQPSGTGTTSGAVWTWTGQAGQNVAGGTNNSGGGFLFAGGAVGSGGTGGSQGSITWQGGGLTASLSGGGMSIPGAVFPPQSAPSTPGTNSNALYSLTGTGHLLFKNSAGTVYDLTASTAAYAAAVTADTASTLALRGASGELSVAFLDLPVASAPPNPAAGFIRYYTDGSGHPTVVNSAGTLLDLAGTVAANRGGTGLSSPGAAGNVLTSTGIAFVSSLPATLFFSLDCTLTGGTVTQASGKTLTNAAIVSVRLKTPSVAVGAPTAVISGNNVVVTSYTAGAIQAATDASTYTVVLAGAV